MARTRTTPSASRRTACAPPTPHARVLAEPMEPRLLLSLTPAGPEYLLTQHPLHEHPAVAADADGDFVVVWHENPFESPYASTTDARAARFDAAGQQSGRPFAVNAPVAPNPDPKTPGAPGAYFPRVAAAPGGDFVVAWTNGRFGVGEVYVRRFDAGGTPRGPEFAVSSVGAGAQESPAVAVDDTGAFVVAWNVRRVDYNGGEPEGIHARRFDASGAALGPDLLVNGGGVVQQQLDLRVAVATDADGDFVVAWNTGSQQGLPFPGEFDVYARRYSAAGEPRGATFGVSETTAGRQALPSVAMDAAGNFVVTWDGDGAGGSEGDVYARRFDAAGAPRGGEFRVNAGPAGEQLLSSVASDAAGNWVVAWTAYDDMRIPSAFARRYLADGTADGAEFRLNADLLEDHFFPAVAVDREGDDVIIAWMGTEFNAPSGVRFRRFTTRNDPDPDPGPRPGAELAPTANPDIPSRTIVHPRQEPILLHLPDSFTDPDGRADELDFTVVDNTNPALASCRPLLPGADTLEVSFYPRVYGSATITVRAVDADGLAARASFEVNIERPPKPPPPGGGGTNGVVRGRLFSDPDGDGRRNNREAAPVGVELFLDADADGVADEEEPTAITLPGGGYEFPEVTAGVYHLRANLPPGLRASGLGAGPLVRAVSVRAGKVAKVKPIGLTPRVLIAGDVFDDRDGDGSRDEAEPGLGGWRVFLDHNGDGARQPSEPAAKSDRTGRWAFARLDRGACRVTLLPRPGYTITSPGGGAFDVTFPGERMTQEGHSFGVATEP